MEGMNAAGNGVGRSREGAEEEEKMTLLSTYLGPTDPYEELQSAWLTTAGVDRYLPAAAGGGPTMNTT